MKPSTRMSGRLLALGLGGAMVLLGCPQTGNDPEPEPESPECTTNADCGTRICNNGTCQDCTPGAAGCVCGTGDACDNGLRCTTERCESCTPGSDGCTCGTGNTCDTGLHCGTGNRCKVCPQGTASCPCRTDGTCNTGLTCGTSNLCQSCTPGERGCPCGSGNTCGTGLRCNASNVCEGCPAGALGCACGTGSTCNTGLRCNTSNMCEACPAGQLGCACGTGDTCGTGLRCNASDVCETCPAGTMGCACGTGDTCGTGLRCNASDVCETCPAGQLGCACGTGDTCGAGLRCNGSKQCEACPAGELGCACGTGDACGTGLRCNGSKQCESCPVGELGCACGTGDTCGTGLRCNGSKLCESCPAGELGCTCDTGDTCGTGLRCNVSKQCESCPAGELGCACDTGDACGAGLRCNASKLCESCPAGELGCACDTGDTCGAGLRCNGSKQCESCPAGELGCACGPSNACNNGLRCNASSQCETCPAGELNCTCGTNDTCTGDLICSGGICSVDTCPAGTLGCACGASATCNQGLTCGTGNTCVACTPDVMGCPCEQGACTGGLVCEATNTTCRNPLPCTAMACVDHQVCQESTPGADAVCLAQCEGDFTWNAAEQRCDPIPDANCTAGAPGSILSDCDARNRVCESMTNSAACGACKDGFTDETATLDVCRAVDTCDIIGGACTNSNRVCVAATAHQDAECGACLDYFTDENGTLPDCRGVYTCTDLAATCDAAHRTCTDHTVTTDATCGACVEGYRPNGDLCEEIPATSCDPTSVNSIVTQCQAEHRTCVEDTPDRAVCGECVNGYFLENNACVPPRLCADLNCAALSRECEGEPLAHCAGCNPGLTPSDPNNPLSPCRPALTCRDVTCRTDQVCVEGVNVADATCGPWPCTDAQGQPDTTRALRQDTNTCVSCGGIQCNEPGESGKLWPYTVAGTNRCICETQDGWYYDDASSMVTRPCDKDGDGWVRVNARANVNSSDPAVRTNARCQIRRVDQVILENEYGERFKLWLCQSGPKPESQGTCTTARPLELYDFQRNDDDSELAPALSTYAASGNGRKLRAKEVNPLTKACINTTTDLNNNQVADVNEWQQPSGSGDATVLNLFTYFVELHRGFYEPPGPGGLYGKYVIQERSRCSNFPVDYRAEDGDYWQDCMRRRDAAFNRTTGNPLVGFDFASWSCATDTGSCPVPPPPTPQRPGVTVPPHGLCQVPPVSDNTWRGMGHYSQFKCVVLTNDVPADRATAPQKMLPTEMFDGVAGPTSSRYQFNTCHVACPAGDATCAQDCASGLCSTSSAQPTVSPNPANPVLACTPTMNGFTNEQVGFVAIRHKASTSSNYVRGCIDEWGESTWRELCPGYDPDNPLGTVGEGNPGDFGRLVCGCGTYYGGPACSMGCPDPMAHWNTGFDPETRTGVWLCGGFTALDGVPLLENPATPSTGYQVRGRIVPEVTPSSPQCEVAGCGSGYVVR